MTKAVFIAIAKIIFETVLVLLAFLGYITQARPFIKKRYGETFGGLIDGIVLTLSVMAIIFYAQYLFAG